MTFSGGGPSGSSGLSFNDGAHHQTWDGFKFANGTPVHRASSAFGGYAGRAAPHHITLRNITILASITSTSSLDHGVYFSYALGGVHDILIDGLNVDGSGGLASAIHAYHSDASNPNAWNVTITDLSVTRTGQAIILWDSTIHDWTISDSTITNAQYRAIRFEEGGTDIAFVNVVSTNSGGFYSSMGANPPGITFVNNSFQ